jgi:hypothetical protein
MHRCRADRDFSTDGQAGLLGSRNPGFQPLNLQSLLLSGRGSPYLYCQKPLGICCWLLLRCDESQLQNIDIAACDRVPSQR